MLSTIYKGLQIANIVIDISLKFLKPKYEELRVEKSVDKILAKARDR